MTKIEKSCIDICIDRAIWYVKSALLWAMEALQKCFSYQDRIPQHLFAQIIGRAENAIFAVKSTLQQLPFASTIEEVDRLEDIGKEQGDVPVILTFRCRDICA